MNKKSNQPLLAGVIGHPIAHSLSPKVHSYWLKKHRISGAYVPLEIKPENLGKTIKQLGDRGFRGVNITVPYKEAVFSMIDRIDDTARKIGAVNTIIINEDDLTVGLNTDAFGFLQNILYKLPNWKASSGPAVVLGAGGASRSVCNALVDEGCPEIRLVNRTIAKAEMIQKQYGSTVKVYSWKEKDNILEGANFLVNTTVLGMVRMKGLDICLDRLPNKSLVCDLVYAPLKTELLTMASARGNPIIDGLGMLLHQACPGFKAWFGVMPAVTDELYQHLKNSVQV